jgi:hypothetical protein
LAAAAALCGQVARGAAAAPPASTPKADTGESVLNVTLVPERALRQPAGAGGVAGGLSPATQAPASPLPPAARAGAATPETPSRSAAVRAGGPAAPAGASRGSGWELAVIAAAAAVLLGGRAAWGRRRRRCPSCRAPMGRLAAAEAFAELDMAERTEQLVGDVRYEVWRCPACGIVDKHGTLRDLGNLRAIDARALAAPVGSAAFLRRLPRSGLSIWTPPAAPPLRRPSPFAAAASRLPPEPSPAEPSPPAVPPASADPP